MAPKVPATCRLPPESGSIHAIIAANPRERLFVHPIAWTTEHLEHLICKLHFRRLPYGRNNTEIATNIPSIHGSAELKELQSNIEEIQNHCMDATENHRLMLRFVAKLCKVATPFRPQRSSSLDFQYHERTVAKIQLPLFFCHQQSTEDVAWAYIDQTCTIKKRFNFYRQLTKAAQVINSTANLPIDPFYVAIMIALAQKIKNARLPGLSEVPKKICLFVTVHLPYENSTNEELDPWHRRPTFVTYLKEYSAIITDEYLKKLEDPLHFHDSSLHIYQKSLKVDTSEDSISALWQVMREACGTQNQPAILKVVSQDQAKKRVCCEAASTEETVDRKRRKMKKEKTTEDDARNDEF